MIILQRDDFDRTGPPAPVGLARNGSRHAGEPKILSCSERMPHKKHSRRQYNIKLDEMQWEEETPPVCLRRQPPLGWGPWQNRKLTRTAKGSISEGAGTALAVTEGVGQEQTKTKKLTMLRHSQL